MKKFLSFLIILQYTQIIFSVIPAWKFDSSTQGLLKENYAHEYIVNSGKILVDQNNGDFDQFVFKRKIYKDAEGKVKQENKLYINGNFSTYTPYDDIESIYRNNYQGKYFGCPKGKFHVYTYDLFNLSEVSLLEPDNEVNEESNWDLKCYYQYEGYLFISYLNNKRKLYQYDFYGNHFFQFYLFENGLSAYSWTTGKNNQPIKPMFAIINNNYEFKFEYLDVYVYRNDHFDYSIKMLKSITELKSKKQAYFTKDTNPTFYYFINYNDENDFETGFNENSINALLYNITYDIGSKKNTTSPFIFYENITINEIKFISYTRFVYYNISIKNKANQNKDKFYYGIIDITLNKIIFNTNEQLLEFKPYNMNSMLAITSENAYKICPIAKDQSGWLECEDECSSGGLIVDSTGRNYCGNKCKDGSYNIWPDNICIDKCDENIYHIDYNAKECKLCKDLNINKNFKITNFIEAGCLENKPGNSYFINEKLGLVACYEGFNYLENNNCVEKCSDNYFLEEGKHICKKCNDECRTCEYSSDHCTSCKNEEYLDFNICKKCNDECRTCEYSSDHCTSCEKDEYLDSNTCKKCNNNKCKTCLKEDDSIKCLSCDQDSKFIYLFNNSCLDECPQNYIPSEDNTTCIFKEPDKKEKGDKSNKANTFAISLIIVLISALLIIIILFFLRRAYLRYKKSNERLEDKIDRELETPSSVLIQRR